MTDLAFFWELTKSTGALWLGAYLLTRGGSNSRTQMTAAALIVWSLSPFGVAMMLVSEQLTFWSRFLVMGYPIMVGLLFGVALSQLIETLPPAQGRPLRRVYHAVIVLGIVIGLFAGLTDSMFDYSTVQLSTERSIQNSFARYGPYEAVYAAYRWVVSIGVGVLFSLVFWRSQRETSAPLSGSGKASGRSDNLGIRYVWLASLVWLVGLASRTLLYQRNVLANSGIAEGFVFQHLSDPIFALAVALLGYGVVQHNAIVRGRIVRRDFVLSLLGAALVVLAFALLPWQLARSLYAFDQPIAYFLILLASWVAILTHVGIERVRRRIDLLLNGDAEAQLRGEVAETMQASIEGKPLAETLDELEQFRPKLLIREHVNKQLLRALDSAEGNSYLAASQLQKLTIVQRQLPEQPTERQRAAAIHTLLDQALAHLEADTAPTNRQQELLAIMASRLREGHDRADIIRRLHLHPRKYDRLLSDGITQLADAILELERTAQ